MKMKVRTRGGEYEDNGTGLGDIFQRFGGAEQCRGRAREKDGSGMSHLPKIEGNIPIHTSILVVVASLIHVHKAYVGI